MEMVTQNAKIQVIKYVSLILAYSLIVWTTLYAIFELATLISAWFFLALIPLPIFLGAVAFALADSIKLFGALKHRRIYIRESRDEGKVFAVFCLYVSLFKVTVYASKGRQSY